MQRDTVRYDPALDDGGGATGAEPQWFIPGVLGDAVYTDSFESDNDFIRTLPYQQPPDIYMPQMHSGNSIPSFVPLDTGNLTDLDSYHYLCSHSSFLTQKNYSDRLHTSNDNCHPQSTAAAIQSDNTSNLYMHPASPASRVGSERYSARLGPTSIGYDHISTSPPQDNAFNVTEEQKLESAQIYLPPPQNDVGDPEVHNTHGLTVSQGLRSYTSHQPTPGPHLTVFSPNASIPTHSGTQENNTWFLAGRPAQPQAISAGCTRASPESHLPYTSRPYPGSYHTPVSPPGELPFDSSQLYSPPRHAPHRQRFQPPHQEISENCSPGDIFDPVGVGTTHRGAHSYVLAGQTSPPITIPPLPSPHHGPTIWPGWMPQQQPDFSGPGLLISVNQHNKSPPQTISSSPETFGYGSQTNGKGPSDGAISSSPTTTIHTGARTPATDPPDTPDYGGLNTFLSQRDPLIRVKKRSRQCRPPVLKQDDCPPNLRPYHNTGIPIPPRECDTMYGKYGDKTLCIKCGYDATPPRRIGLKCEHVSAHINNRPYHCVHCKQGFFRKSNHTSKSHPPLWRTMPPSR